MSGDAGLGDRSDAIGIWAGNVGWGCRLTTCWEARQLAGIAKTVGWSRRDTTLQTTDTSLPSYGANTRGNCAHTSANAKSALWNGSLAPSRRPRTSMICCGRAARKPPCGSNRSTIGFDPVHGLLLTTGPAYDGRGNSPGGPARS